MTSPAKPCPICRRPRDHAFKQQGDKATQNPYAPFCSARCRDRDLARWFSDSYTVPGPPADPEQIAAEDWDTKE